MQLTLPDLTLEEHPVTMRQNVSAVRGWQDAVELEQQISLGRPAVVPLDDVPTDLSAAVSTWVGTPQHRCHWIITACTFAPGELVITEASLSLSLSAPGLGDDQQPIAVLMIPDSYAQAITLKDKITAGIEATAGALTAKLGSEQAVEEVVETRYLQALHLQTSRPQWAFRDDDGTKLTRNFRLVTLVASHPGTPAEGRLTLAVKARRQGFARVFSQLQTTEEITHFRWSP